MLNLFPFQNNVFAQKEVPKQQRLLEPLENMTLSYNEKEVERKKLYVITLGPRLSDNINGMITISNFLLIQSNPYILIWDLVNLIALTKW